MATETKTFYPGAYDTSDYQYRAISGEANPVGKGTNNTNLAAEINGMYSEVWTYWPFDVSSIPVGAEIDSVSCDVRAQSPVSSGTSTLQLYSGGAAKGTATRFTTNAVYSLSAGTWTRGELTQIRLRIYANFSAAYKVKFYGADLTVVYSVKSEKFMLKLSGGYEDVARTFKKVNGIWVEQTDLANVIEDGVRYQNGGEIIVPKFTIDGTTYYFEDGMTWGKWIASNYNTGGFYLSGANVYSPDGNRVFYYVSGDSGMSVYAVESLLVVADKKFYTH